MRGRFPAKTIVRFSSPCFSLNDNSLIDIGLELLVKLCCTRHSQDDGLTNDCPIPIHGPIMYGSRSMGKHHRLI